jgi:hypothetical protein
MLRPPLYFDSGRSANGPREHGANAKKAAPRDSGRIALNANFRSRLLPERKRPGNAKAKPSQVRFKSVDTKKI